MRQFHDVKTKINLPERPVPRVVVIGGGFGGLALVQGLDPKKFQVVMLDRNNHHQFQPLLYQVASASLEPSSTTLPFRKVIRPREVLFRMAEVISINPDLNQLNTDLGIVNYDFLVIATGSKTRYFGAAGEINNAIPMKSVSEALALRNRVLEDCEKALACVSREDRHWLLTTVIAGGGPTGVELAGALAEMKTQVITREYPEIDPKEVTVQLVESGTRILKNMSEQSSAKALRYLGKMGVGVILRNRVVSYDGNTVTLSSAPPLQASKLIWTAGVTAATIPFLRSAPSADGRYEVDSCLRVIGTKNIFAIGDVAALRTQEYPTGHPQVAPVAISQAKFLARNFNSPGGASHCKGFVYKNRGSMATVGRHAAVAEIGKLKLGGFPAWLLWLAVHLGTTPGLKNKLFTLGSWMWNYATRDQPLRAIITPAPSINALGTRR